MKTTMIKCDGCASDLSDAGAMPTYALELASFGVRNSGNIMYDVAVSPDIRRSHHFCGLACLDLWRDRERFSDNLWRERNEAWKESQRNGREGDLVSWRSMPDEVRAAAGIEIDAACLEAFPMRRVLHRRS